MEHAPCGKYAVCHEMSVLKYSILGNEISIARPISGNNFAVPFRNQICFHVCGSVKTKVQILRWSKAAFLKMGMHHCLFLTGRYFAVCVGLFSTGKGATNRLLNPFSFRSFRKRLILVIPFPFSDNLNLPHGSSANSELATPPNVISQAHRLCHWDIVPLLFHSEPRPCPFRSVIAKMPSSVEAYVFFLAVPFSVTQNGTE